MIRPKACLSISIATAALCMTAALHRAEAQTVAIRAGRLFDTRSGELLTDELVLIRGERISAVGPYASMTIPPGARVVNLGGATVLPGLVDAHTHIYEGLSGAARINTSIEAWTLLALKNAQTDLYAGFTTLRDLSTHGEGYGDVAVRDAIRRGLFEGPRLQVSTRGLRTGPIYAGAPGITIPATTENVTGADQARKAVREQIHYGADWIKVYACGAYSFDADGKLWADPTFTLAEVEAIVDEAHRHRRKVACHAYAGEGLRDCIVAGVDSIEHGEGLDDSLIGMMLQKGIYYEPTLYRYSMPEVVKRDHAASGGKYSLAAFGDRAFREALARGVKISFGSGVDGSPYAHGTQATEFEAMVEHGMTPLQAIDASVKVAVEMLGLQNEIGSIQKGKRADLIAVSGNPLEDITELGRVKFVMKNGKVVRDDLEGGNERR